MTTATDPVLTPWVAAEGDRVVGERHRLDCDVAFVSDGWRDR